jgi:hypothetical protein
MLRKALLWFIISIPCVYLLLSFGIVFFIQHHAYEAILSYYTLHWPTAFDVSKFAERCLTPQWYHWVTAHALLLEAAIVMALAVYCLLIQKIKKGVKLLVEDVRRVLVFMKQTLLTLTIRERWLLLGLFALIGCYRYYFFVRFPLHPDEAASYLFFTRQGPVMAAVNYVTTNNHIFLNLICSMLAKLSFLSAKWVMRLPAMTGDMALLLGIFCLVKHFGRFARAFWVVAGIAFCYILSYYATQGRGYQWQEISAVVSSGCCWWYFFSPAGFTKKGYGLFIAASVAGFYINPLFVYPFGTLMLAAGYLFTKRTNRAGIVPFVKAVLAIVLFAFVLYLPLILASSWNALVNNGFINENQQLSGLADEVGDLVFSFNYVINYGSAGIGLLVVGTVCSLVLYYRRTITGVFYNMMLVWFVAALASFVIITVYQKVFPPERALCFWILIVDIIFLNVLYDFFNRLFPSKATWLFALLVCGKVVFSIRTIYWPKYAINNKEQVVIYNQIQPQFDQLSALGASTWQITHSDDYYSMFLPLYLIAHKKEEAIILNRKQGMADVIFLPDKSQPGFDLRGYTLWKEGQITAQGKWLSIYAKEKLIVK